MAVNYTDFEKIWASTSPLTPYSFSDANYKRGWDFVGSTPPSRQMWDAFMQNADEKLQYLYLHEDVPVGHEYFTFNPNVPQGSLPLFGGEYSRETYSALWSWVQQQTGYLKTEAEWQALAASNNGNVPYYSNGDGSTTFRVPSLKCWVKAANGTVNEVGSYLAAGLPNITGDFRNDTNGTAWMVWDASGVFMQYGNQPGNALLASATGATQGNRKENVSFDASRSNPIYGNANTVQPESIVGMWLVKAYGTIQDTGTINEQQYIDDRLATKLSVNGGTMYAPISFNTTGQIGYRGTAHVDNTTILRQLIVSSGDIDNWNDGNAKIALHTYSADNSSEDGSFNLLATDGTNSATLQGKPNSDLLWNGKNLNNSPDLSVFNDYENFTAPTVFSNRLKVVPSGKFGGYKQVGNLVYVHYTFQMNVNMNKGAWTVAGGFPQPFVNDGAWSRVPLTISAWYGDNESGYFTSAALDGGGTLYLILSGNVTAGTSEDTTHGIIVHGVYFAK